MAFKVCFAGVECGIQVAVFGFINHHVGDDAFGLNAAATWGVVAGGGDLDGSIRPQGAYGLHRAFAKSLVAHHGGPFVVLQGSSDNFAGRSRAFIDQDHKLDVFQRTLCGLGQRCNGVMPQMAAPEFRVRTISELAVLKLSVGRYHDRIVRQECSRQGHGRVQQAARVIAKVQHQPLERTVLVQILHFACEVLHRPFLELRHAHPAVTWLDQLGLDRLGLDFFTHDGDAERPVLILAVNAKHDLGVGLAAHALDSLVERQTFDRCVIYFGDQVVGLEAGAEGRRAFDG